MCDTSQAYNVTSTPTIVKGPTSSILSTRANGANQ